MKIKNIFRNIGNFFIEVLTVICSCDAENKMQSIKEWEKTIDLKSKDVDENK